MRVGLTTTAIFVDLSGYFFGNIRDKASNIIWRYATPCWPVIDCTMNNLEWPWVAISCKTGFFRTSSFQLLKMIAWKVINIEPHYEWQKYRSMTILVRRCYFPFRHFQYKSFVDIRRRFLPGRRQTWVGSLKLMNLPFSRRHIFVRFRNNVGIKCTLRPHTVLDFCRHQ